MRGKWTGVEHYCLICTKMDCLWYILNVLSALKWQERPLPPYPINNQRSHPRSQSWRSFWGAWSTRKLEYIQPWVKGVWNPSGLHLNFSGFREGFLWTHRLHELPPLWVTMYLHALYHLLRSLCLCRYHLSSPWDSNGAGRCLFA